MTPPPGPIPRGFGRAVRVTPSALALAAHILPKARAPRLPAKARGALKTYLRDSAALEAPRVHDHRVGARWLWKYSHPTPQASTCRRARTQPRCGRNASPPALSLASPPNRAAERPLALPLASSGARAPPRTSAPQSDRGAAPLRARRVVGGPCRWTTRVFCRATRAGAHGRSQRRPLLILLPTTFHPTTQPAPARPPPIARAVRQRQRPAHRSRSRPDSGRPIGATGSISCATWRPV
jgi:hypothetical protein